MTDPISSVREYPLSVSELIGVVESLGEVILTLNGEQVEWVTPSISVLAGWLPEDMIGHSLSSFSHPDDAAALLEWESSHSRDPISFKLRHRDKDADAVEVDSTVVPVHAVDGSDKRIVLLMDSRASAHVKGLLVSSLGQLQATLDSELDPHIIVKAVRDTSGSVVDFIIVEANKLTSDFYAIPRDEIVGQSLSSIFYDTDDTSLLALFAESLNTGETITRSAYSYRSSKTGRMRSLDFRGVPSGDTISFGWHDTTERNARMAAAEEAERLYRLMAENTTDVILQVAPKGEIVWISDSVEAVLGWQLEQIKTIVGVSLIHAEDHMKAIELAKAHPESGLLRGEYRVLCSDGSYLWMSGVIHRVQSDDGVYRIISLRSIQNEVDARNELEHALGHDPLTGLPTRASIAAKTETFIEQLAFSPHSVGMLCIGVDELTRVNDALTHASGDLVLAAVAARIANTIGKNDIFGRAMGDEFLIAVPRLVNASDASILAEKVLKSAQGALTISGHTITPTVSVGIATGRHGTNAEDLIRDAKLALRQAKNNGRNRYEFVDPVLARDAQQRLTMEALVKEGLVSDEFKAWFMPIVRLSTNTLSGYEALSRWVKADGTVVEPDAYLRAAESSLTIVDIDIVVLREALAVLSRLPSHISMAVNVSSRTLARREYVSEIEELLSLYAVEGFRLHLEVTETALLNITEDVIRDMETIASLGVKWYVDDFGTGYSSISHLRDLPIKGLKLDRSFTEGILKGNPKSMRLAAALVGLADGLELDTVAEGVETIEQIAVLAAQGWDHGQGWFYGRAATIE